MPVNIIFVKFVILDSILDPTVQNDLFRNDIYLRLQILKTKEDHTGSCLDPSDFYKSEDKLTRNVRILKLFDDTTDLLNNKKFIDLYTPAPKKCIFHPRCNFYTTYKIIGYDIIFDEIDELSLLNTLQNYFSNKN
jgi:hypothetical protein